MNKFTLIEKTDKTMTQHLKGWIALIIEVSGWKGASERMDSFLLLVFVFVFILYAAEHLYSFIPKVQRKSETSKLST